MGQTSQQLLDTKTSIIKCLLTYGFISGTNVLYQDQINILEMLVDFEYTYTDEEDVKIVGILLGIIVDIFSLLFCRFCLFWTI